MRSSLGTHKLQITLIAGCILLGGLASAYFVKGFHYLVFVTNGAGDLRERWVEQQYVFQGQNPNDVFYDSWSRRQGINPPKTTRDVTIDPEIGPPLDAAYPPWALLTGYLFLWPDWPMVRWVYAAWNIFALGVIGFTAWQIGRGDILTRSFLVISVMAVSAYCTTLEIGNYTIIVLAMLMAAILASERDRPVVAGFLLGLAMLKPTLSGPFLLIFIVKQRLREPFVAAAWIVVASSAIWWITKTNPFEMILQMLRDSERYKDRGYGLLNVLSEAGFSSSLTSLTVALGTVLCSFVIMLIARRQSIWTLAAVAAFAGRVWTHHAQYDNALLVFVLLALAEQASHKLNLAIVSLVLLTGLTLWAPGRVTEFLIFRVFQFAVWIAAISVVLKYGRTEFAYDRELVADAT